MSESSEAQVTLPPGLALHARPAAKVAGCAMDFRASIWVTLNAQEANAESILALLGLGATGGSVLGIRAEGPDAEAAVERISALLLALR